jgi:hypothetical protein
VGPVFSKKVAAVRHRRGNRAVLALLPFHTGFNIIAMTGEILLIGSVK